jgi:hypothetical protein
MNVFTNILLFMLKVSFNMSSFVKLLKFLNDTVFFFCFSPFVNCVSQFLN